MAKQLDLGFWTKEKELLFAVLFPHVRTATLDGAQSAGDDLVERFSAGIDMTVVNQAAIRSAREYTYDLVTRLNDTSQQFLQTEIPAWIDSGQPLPALIDTITPMFGPVRAEMVAATEVTRAFADGNTTAWKESGLVTGRKWMTAEDELVCPVCGDLDGKQMGMDEPFGDEFDNPPAHPRCRCYIQPVVNDG